MAIDLVNVFNKITQSLRVGKQSAFGEIGTYNLKNIFAYQSTWGSSYQRDITNSTGSGNINDSGAILNISSGTTANSTASVKTVARGEYQPGKAVEWGVAAQIIGDVTGDAVVEIGLFDANNGYFYRIQENNLNLVVLRQGNEVLDIPVSQANIDKLNGKGLSKKTWNVNESYIYGGKFTWYGIGTLLFSILSPDSSLLSDYQELSIHTFLEDNFPSILEPNLPIAVKVNNGTTTNDIKVKLGGRRYDVMGEFVPDSRITGDRRLAQSIGASDLTPLISFKRKDIFPADSSRENSVNCFLNSYDVITDNDLELYVVSGGTINGTFGNLSNYRTEETCLEVNTTATTISDFYTLTGPYLFSAGARGRQEETTSEKDLRIILRENDPITLVGRSLSGNITVSSAIRIVETW